MTAVIRRSVQWLPVDGRWTRVSVMGAGLNEEMIKLNGCDENHNENTTAILLIPGNPGNERFYEHFGRELLSNIEKAKLSTPSIANQQYVLYTVSHLNHVPMPGELIQSGAQKAADRFNLSDQIQHKVDFCVEYLPKTGRVVMLAHSIGSYIMLRILPTLLEYGYNVVSVQALFPTVERMAKTPQGKTLLPFLSVLDSYDTFLTRPLTFWMDLLPVNVRWWLGTNGFRLSSLRSKTEGVPECVFESVPELLHSGVFRNVVHMAHDELHKVSDFDETLLNHLDITRFCYGKTDRWCPLEFSDDMKGRLGNDSHRVNLLDCEHAFVIRDNEEMARKLAVWVIG